MTEAHVAADVEFPAHRKHNHEDLTCRQAQTFVHMVGCWNLSTALALVFSIGHLTIDPSTIAKPALLFVTQNTTTIADVSMVHSQGNVLVWPRRSCRE